MAKGLSIKPIEPLIAETFNSMYELDSKVTAKEVQAKVRTKLKDKYKDKELPPDWPSVSAVGKVITKIRPKFGTDPLDEPFCLGKLVKYPIPPEVLPVVLRVWAKRLEEAKPDKDGFSFQMTFTVRDALWVARLAKLFDDPEAIWGFAFWYSVRERAYEAIGEDMDTSDLDTELLKNFKPTPTESKRKKKGGTT